MAGTPRKEALIHLLKSTEFLTQGMAADLQRDPDLCSTVLGLLQRTLTGVKAMSREPSKNILLKDPRVPSQAMRMVFDTTQLAEAIFAYLDLHQLMRSQLMCRRVLNVIAGSLQLQRNMLKQPSPATDHWLYDGKDEIGMAIYSEPHMVSSPPESWTYLVGHALTNIDVSPNDEKLVCPAMLNPVFEQSDIREANCIWASFKFRVDLTNATAPWHATYFSQPVPRSIEILACWCSDPKAPGEKMPASHNCGGALELDGGVTIGEAMHALDTDFHEQWPDEEINWLGCTFILFGVVEADAELRRKVAAHTAAVEEERSKTEAHAAQQTIVTED